MLERIVLARIVFGVSVPSIGPATPGNEGAERPFRRHWVITVMSVCPVPQSDTNVKEVVRTMPRRKMISRGFSQVAGPDVAFRDAVRFEVAVARLCQLSAVRPQHLGNRSNDTEKMEESA
jgi:hypothetical protein